MPQKVEQTFDGLSKFRLAQLTDSEKRVHKEIQTDNTCPLETKYLSEIMCESEQLTRGIQVGYDSFLNKFEQLVQDLKSRSCRSSGEHSPSPANENVGTLKDKNNAKKDRFEL